MSPETVPTPPPGPRRRRGAKLLAGALGLLLLAVLTVGIGVWWTLGTAPGTAWLLARLPGVTAEAPRGALAGDFSAGRVVVELNGGRTRVALTDVGWRGVSLGRGDGRSWARLTIAALFASSVDVVLTPAPNEKTGGPPTPPKNLELPVELALESLKIGTIRATPLGAASIDKLDAALRLGADAGTVHRIDRLALHYGQIAVDARARIGAAAPMTLDASVDASQVAAGALPAWGARLHLAGPLAEPVLDANLRAAPVTTPAPEPTPPPVQATTAPRTGAVAAAPPAPSVRAAQTLHLHAVLRPFAPWPLGDLSASAKALDLSAFVVTAPGTALDLTAHATSSGADRPAVVDLELVNAAPGRYDQGRLPLRSLRAEIAARPDRATEIELRSLAIALGVEPRGSNDAGDGRIEAHGSWSPSRWQLDATIDGLAARRLDGRAPALTLTGPVSAAGGAAAADAKGIDLKTRLTGTLDDAGSRRPVSLTLDSSFDLAGPGRRLRLATLEASAGKATLTAAGSATQADPAARWVVKADASLHEFDPAVWLPGDDRSPWRGTGNRIDAQLAIDGSAPLPAPGTSALDALAEARGRATLAIGRGTLLAGVALAGTASVQSPGGGGAGGDAARLQADLDAGGNSLHVDGRFATRGKPAGDAFDLALDARALATLAPVFKVLQPAGADTRLAGRLTAHARLDGRWPNVTTRGDLDAEGLQVGALQLQRAVAQWLAGTAATDRVSLNATVDQLRLQPKGGAPGPSLEAATLQLGGTARAHTLDVRLTTRARPPAWAEAATGMSAPHPAGSASAPTVATAATAATIATGPPLLATSSGNGAPPTRLTIATLSARGGLVDQKNAALSGWRGTLQSIDVIGNAAPGAPLLRGRGLALEAFWAGGPLRVAVQPGRFELLGGALRWSQLRYAAAAPAPVVVPTARPRASSAATATVAAPVPGLPSIDVDATIEPLRIAPLLAQAQPSFGWGGDLAIGGHLRLRSGDAAAAGVELDGVLERSGGDLTLTDEFGTRPLGLGEARVGVRADRGLWKAEARFAGSALGTATVDAALQTSPQLLMPSADAPITGRVALDISDLGSLGSWVPPGWRIGGALRADATLAGTLGRPDYTGQVVGSRITARNFLEGVNATDGDLLVRLTGTTATLDHFTARGGDGSLRVTGLANFEAAPDVRLEIDASRFQVLGRIDRKVVASGRATVHIDARATTVTGQFGVDQGLFDITRSDAPKLDEDVTVVRAAGVLSPAAAASAAASPENNAPVPVVASVVGPVAQPAASAASAARAIDLNLQLDLGQQLAIRGHGLATRLTGTLAVSSPDSKLAVNGTVSVVDGTFKAYGQDLVIDRGLIAFTGPVDRPRLDIEATRPKLDNVKVGVTITGSVANPRIRLFSEPELSDVDKLSWLVVGRGSDDLGRNESALLQSAAMALVSGDGNGEPGITDRVTKALGLDELSLGQSDGTVKQTVVNIGKKLSDRWTIGYQGGLSAAAGSVQLIYKVARRLTVRAQAGSDSSLDLIWTWRWE